MAITVRSFILTSIPALAAIFGFLWFTRKKKQTAIDDKKPKDKVDVRPKEKSALSASDNGTPVAVKQEVSQRPPDENKHISQESVKSYVKSDSVSSKDEHSIRMISIDSPLASSTPIVPASALNNNASTNPEKAAEEEIIEPQVQSIEFTTCPKDQEIGQGDRSRSSERQESSSETASPDSSNVQDMSSTQNSQKVVVSGSCSIVETVPETVIGTKSSSSEAHGQSDSPPSMDSEEEEEEDEEADVTVIVPTTTAVIDDATDAATTSTTVEESTPATAEPEDSEVSAMNNGMIAEATASENSSAGSPAETPTNGLNGSHSNGLNGSHSDAQSEHSADSGQGSSIVGGGAVAGDGTEKVEYKFNFPQEMCGMLIGRRGAHIKELKERSNAEISVRDKLYTAQYKLIVLEGSQKSIDIALDIVMKRFPPHKFGPIDFSPAPAENPVLVPEVMQLSLPDGIPVDVNVSSVVSANHLFIQLPSHPSFFSLEKQNGLMVMCYGAPDAMVPQLPRPIEVGMICAAPIFNGWYRAQVVAVYDETEEVDIKYVDYGGYAKTQSCLLRQIRSDFTTLPFQAIECYLANVIPPLDMVVFPPTANAVLEEMVQGRLIRAEVVGYENDGVPYLQLYQIMVDQPDQPVLLINRELVNRGVARWIEQQL